MARKSTLADLMKAAPDPVRTSQPGAPAAAAPGAPVSPAPGAGSALGAPVASGALRAMGLSLERLSADAGKARDLEAMLAAGDRVIELDPGLIDGSFVRDRIGEADDGAPDPAFESLQRSIRDQGQQVPILVRPAAEAGRFQVAYGHRRLRAIARMGGKVRAIVRPMSDVELVIAQARENLDRRDLSYVEKAMFARRLEEQFDRPTLMSALGVDKADLSRLLSLAHTLPVDVVQAIGPAPRAGRPRWSRLAAALDAPGAAGRFKTLANSAEFRASPSDRRFTLALEQLTPDATAQPGSASATGHASLEITGPDGGEPLARLENGRGGGRIVFASDAFGAFVREKLPELARAFALRRGAGD